MIYLLWILFKLSLVIIPYNVGQDAYHEYLAHRQLSENVQVVEFAFEPIGSATDPIIVMATIPTTWNPGVSHVVDYEVKGNHSITGVFTIHPIQSPFADRLGTPVPLVPGIYETQTSLDQNNSLEGYQWVTLVGAINNGNEVSWSFQTVLVSTPDAHRETIAQFWKSAIWCVVLLILWLAFMIFIP